MHGYGECTWADGRRYLGDYSHGRKHGYGEFYWPDGRAYKGEWKHGRWTNGVHITANGVCKKIANGADKLGLEKAADDNLESSRHASPLGNTSRSEVQSLHL